MQSIHNPFEISDEQARLDFRRIHGWLTTTYWAAGITRPKVEKAARNSALVIGAYLKEAEGNPQVGYCRVVSDKTRFAWLADVFVHPEHRGQGLARAMVRFALDHPELADVHYWLLGTKDAQGVYEGIGFGPLDDASRMMQIRKPQSL